MLDAAIEVSAALTKLQNATESTDVDLDPEWSFEEQLGVRMGEALELVEDIYESLEDEYERRGK